MSEWRQRFVNGSWRFPIPNDFLRTDIPLSGMRNRFLDPTTFLWEIYSNQIPFSPLQVNLNAHFADNTPSSSSDSTCRIWSLGPPIAYNAVFKLYTLDLEQMTASRNVNQSLINGLWDLSISQLFIICTVIAPNWFHFCGNAAYRKRRWSLTPNGGYLIFPSLLADFMIERLENRKQYSWLS
jgi:hypothetical protein